MPNGFGSKDLWVTATNAGAAAAQHPAHDDAEVHLRRTGRDLLSRTADNLFWLGRYSERAEAIMRLLRSVLARFLEDGRPDSNPDVLQRLLRLFLQQNIGCDPAAREAGLGRRRGAGRRR